MTSFNFCINFVFKITQQLRLNAQQFWHHSIHVHIKEDTSLWKWTIKSEHLGNSTECVMTIKKQTKQRYTPNYQMGQISATVKLVEHQKCWKHIGQCFLSELSQMRSNKSPNQTTVVIHAFKWSLFSLKNYIKIISRMRVIFLCISYYMVMLTKLMLLKKDF